MLNYTASIAFPARIKHGQTLNLNVTGDIINSGTLAGRSIANLTAENIKNLGGRISATDVNLVARNDLSNLGGVIDGVNSITASAGRDINLASTTRDTTSAQGKRTAIDRVAGLYITGTGGTLTASAGRDLNLDAATIANGLIASNPTAAGTTTLVAGRNINLNTVLTSNEQAIIWDSKNFRKETARTEIGSTIQSRGDTLLVAGNDVTARAANVSSQGALQVSAGNNIAITSGETNRTLDEAHQTKSKTGLFSKQTTDTRDTVDETRAIGSSLTGNRVGLTANNDITLQGSALAAQTDINVLAGNNITLTSAQNERRASQFSATQKSSLSTKGVTKSSSEETITQLDITRSGSSIRSAQGDIALSANLNQNSAPEKGLVLVDSSQIIADAGRVDISAKHIIVSASEEQSSRERTLKESKSTFAFNTGLPTGQKRTVEESSARSTLKASTIAGATGVDLTAQGVVDITASRLAATDGDITIRGAEVSIQSGLDRSNSNFKETTKKTGVNLKDLTGTFKPGQGVGFNATLTKENAQTTLALATLDAQNIAIQSTAGDITLAAIDARATTLTLDAARNLNLASRTTTEYQSTDLKKKDLAWQSVKGGGTLDETTQYNRLNVDQLNVLAGNRITADLGVRDSVTLLAQQPGMGWLKQLQDDPALAGKIDWKSIEETHKKWDYQQQGLTPAAAVVVTIVVAFFTAGAGTGIVGGITGTAVTATSSATVIAASAVVQAGVTSLASKAAVSLINNGGDLGATLKELGSKDNLRQLATSLATAGVLSAIGQIEYAPGKTFNNVKVGDGFSANVGKNLINGLARATLNSALSGTDLETSIRTETIASILNAASAQGANFVGDQATEGGFLINDAGKVNEFGRAFAHAVVGCAAGAAGASAGGSNIGTGSGCGAGALGAVVGELAAQLYGGANPTKTIAFASALSGIAAALAGQGAEGVSIAAATGANAAENNYLSHANAEQLKKLKKDQQNGQCGPTCEKSIAGLVLLDQLSNRALLNACVNGSAAECQAQVNLDPAALQYELDNIGKIAVGRFIAQAGNNGGKALGSLGQALAKTELQPLVDAKGFITGWAVDLGGADPDTLRYWLGAGVYVGSVILPSNAVELIPGVGTAVGKGLKVVTRGTERVVVEEVSGKVLGRIGDSSKIVPGGGLAAHEYAGGHLIDRHVGLAESDLAARLVSDPKIKVASTFTDRATAEAAVSNVLDSNAVAIQTFLNSTDRTLVLNGSLPNPVGISLGRGSPNAIPASNVRVVLQRDASLVTGYRVVTGFPIP